MLTVCSNCQGSGIIKTSNSHCIICQGYGVNTEDCEKMFERIQREVYAKFPYLQEIEQEKDI